jgi:hypothetical protein
MIMILSNYWQISLSMAIHLTCFILLCLIIASALYKNRKDEKKKLSGKENKVRVIKKLSQDIDYNLELYSFEEAFENIESMNLLLKNWT